MKKKKSLVKQLFGEVYQTERSAIRHPLVEAKRLGKCPPADAFRAVSKHAKSIEKSLKALGKKRGVGSSFLGLAVGDLFSISRNRLADFGLTAEQSYRGTILGMRHGVDVITLFGLAAHAEGDEELAAWCDDWLAERRPLVEACANALKWFAENPKIAMKNAKHPRD